MRILHVNKFLYRRGGAEGYLLDLAALQRDAGHAVEFFGMDHPENLPMRYSRHFPAHVEYEPTPAAVSARLALAGRMLWCRSAQRGMAAVVDDFAPDVIHFHNIYHHLSPSVIRAATASGATLVMTLHDYKLVCPTYRFLDQGAICTACVHGGLRQAPLRRCKDGSLAASALAAFEVGAHRLAGAYAPLDALVCPSRFLHGQLTAAGIHRDRLVHVDNFTSVDVPQRAGAGEGIVYAGRLSPEKGIDVLIRALARLPDARLDIAGDGSSRAALVDLADAAAPGRIRFHGRLDTDRLRLLLAGARVSVLPARWLENQPLAVLESFAAGVPVVASALGGIPELIEPGPCGALVPPQDPAALAAALGDYLADPDRARVHGHAARARVLAQHAPAAHLRAITALYGDIRATRSPAAVETPA